MQTLQKATYVSIWDDTDAIETDCLVSISEDGRVTVSEIESADEPEDANTCTDEYVEMPDGTIYRTFFNEDAGIAVVGEEHEAE